MNTRLTFGSKEGTAGTAACEVGVEPLPAAIGTLSPAFSSVAASSSTSWSSNAGVAIGAGTPGESRLTNGPVGVCRIIPAYRPFSFTISRPCWRRSGGRPNVRSILVAIASFGNFALRYRSKNSFEIRGFMTASRRAARSSPSSSGATSFRPRAVSLIAFALTPPSVRPYAMDAPARAGQALLVGLTPIARAISGGDPSLPAKLSMRADAIPAIEWSEENQSGLRKISLFKISALFWASLFRARRTCLRYDFRFNHSIGPPVSSLLRPTGAQETAGATSTILNI
jgi:hypothetical protein